MSISDHAVETANSVIWIDDGIIRLRRQAGTLRSAETVADAFTVIRDLLDGMPPVPALFDLRNRLTSDKEAWTPFVSNALLFSAVAFLFDSESLPRIGDWPRLINQMLTPLQLFTDEAEALAFLQGFVPSE